jgi:hypothetical protein
MTAATGDRELLPGRARRHAPAVARQRQAVGRHERRTPAEGFGRRGMRRWTDRAAEAERVARAQRAGRMRRTGWRANLLAGWCSLLLALGLYLGGWSQLDLLDDGLGLFPVSWPALLFAGLAAAAAWVLRAAWAGPTSARVPGLGAFWPEILSTTSVVAVTALFLQDVSPAAAPVRPPAGTGQVDGLLGLLAHNLLFVAPMLLLLLRWQTPLGAFTVMSGSVALLVVTRTEPGLVGLVGAAVLGGAAADVAVALLRPSPQRRWAARAVAAIAPAVCWSAHFALLAEGYGIGTEPGIWLGSVAWASLSGLALALLMWPPAVPLTAWNRGRARPAVAAAPTPTSARMVGR